MILVCVGTRPELIKMAPVCALAKSRGLNVHVHCTMQSPDLVDRAILPWDTEGSLLPLMHSNPRPRLVVVQGDTRTAFEAAVMAYELALPIFYVESGVRTYDLSSPWPEEGYRRAITAVATYHACTTDHNFRNLGREGFVRNRRVTGSPIVESVRGRAEVPFGPTSYVVITLHRRENRGHFRDIVAGVLDAVGTMSVAWHSHPNGWAAQEARDLLIPSPPLDATAFAGKMARAKLVVTDSGGVQEECNALGVPCVVARDKTDRPESVGKGGAILAGTSWEGVAKAIREALAMDRTTIDRTIFGDGTASEKIIAWWSEIVG